MAAPTTLDANARCLSRTRLTGVQGVERVVMDEESGSVLVLYGQADRGKLKTDLKRAIKAAGFDPAEVHLAVARRHGARRRRRRVRFERVEHVVGENGRLRVRVVVEWGGSKSSGEAEAIGERGGPIELRTAALATLAALDQLVGRALSLRIIGIKQVRAFDADLIVLSLHDREAPTRRYVGAVTVESDPLYAAGIAVLKALNRKLGHLLNPED